MSAWLFQSVLPGAELKASPEKMGEVMYIDGISVAVVFHL